MSRRIAISGLVAALVAVVPRLVSGQQSEALNRGYDYERRGNYAGAEAIYLGVLDAHPADLGALLGLERVLVPLNRPMDLVGPLRLALTADSTQGIIYGIAIRTWTSMGQPDSVRLAALRWARQHPDDDAPYREWGAAMLAMQNRAGARQAYTMGRERLGRSDALAAELAQLAVQEQNYREATREWIVAVRDLPGYRGTAVSTLAPAPLAVHPELLATIDAASGPTARGMAVDLRARWGDPLGALQRLMTGLPGGLAGRDELQQFLSVLKSIATRDATRARARVYEAMAERAPAAQQPSLRLEAARAYGDGGEPADARRMLSSARPGSLVAGHRGGGSGDTGRAPGHGGFNRGGCHPAGHDARPARCRGIGPAHPDGGLGVDGAGRLCQGRLDGGRGQLGRWAGAPRAAGTGPG